MFLRFRPHDNYKPMNVIVEEEGGILWLGDYTAAMDKPTLQAKGIKTVLTVAQGLGVAYSASQNINHKIYSVLDIESANIQRIWNDTYTQIDQGLKNGGVLVHCAAGISRSSSTVMAYLMRKRQIPFAEAYSLVKSKRSIICPNTGFMRQLKQYEIELNRKVQNAARQLVEQQPERQGGAKLQETPKTPKKIFQSVERSSLNRFDAQKSKSDSRSQGKRIQIFSQFKTLNERQDKQSIQTQLVSQWLTDKKPNVNQLYSPKSQTQQQPQKKQGSNYLLDIKANYQSLLNIQ